MADIVFLVVVLGLAIGGFAAMRRAGWLDRGDDHDVETARAAARAEDGRTSQLGPFT